MFLSSGDRRSVCVCGRRGYRVVLDGAPFPASTRWCCPDGRLRSHLNRRAGKGRKGPIAPPENGVRVEANYFKNEMRWERRYCLGDGNTAAGWGLGGSVGRYWRNGRPPPYNRRGRRPSATICPARQTANERLPPVPWHNPLRARCHRNRNGHRWFGARAQSLVLDALGYAK